MRVILFLLLALLAAPAVASDAKHDPRPLTAQEFKVFLPLICYLDAPQKEGIVYFALHGKTINVMMPEGLNLQSAFIY